MNNYGRGRGLHRGGYRPARLTPMFGRGRRLGPQDGSGPRARLGTCPKLSNKR
jgi:hypothetical protein